MCPATCPVPPDLAVEGVAPGDLDTEIAEKVGDWLAAGTQLVIIVDPRRRTIAVHRSPTALQTLTITCTLSGDPVIPGWIPPCAPCSSRSNEG